MVFQREFAHLVDVILKDIWPRLVGAAPGLARGEALRALLWAIAARMVVEKGIAGPAREDALRLIGGAAESPPEPDGVEAAAHLTEAVNWPRTNVRLLGDLYAALREDRRADGRYFTPHGLAARVAGWTLPGESQTRRMQIVDPAMGSGHFLIAAAEHFVGAEADSATRWEALRGLHGSDRDGLAVELARIALWLWAGLAGTSPAQLADRLRCGDALRDDLWADRAEGFDAVIGNPPYASVFTRAQAGSRHDLGDQYTSASGSFDLAAPFVERSIRLLRDGGRCGLVLPNKLLAADWGRSLRRWIQANAVVERIVDLTAAGVFDAEVYPVVCIFRKGSARDDEALSILKGEPPETVRAGAQRDLRGTPGDVWSAALDPQYEAIRVCWNEATAPLGEMATISAGLTVEEAYALRDVVIEAPPNWMPGGFYQLMTTGLIRRYGSAWGSARATYLRRTYRRPVIAAHTLPVRRRQQAAQPKILIAGIGLAPRALVDRGMMQASVATVVIEASRWPLDSLCALLNSRLAGRLYRALFGGLALSGGYLRFGKRELALLPIPDAAGDDPRVARLAALGARAGSEPRCEAEIDALVCEMYGVGMEVIGPG
jgi:hypothetical protein